MIAKCTWTFARTYILHDIFAQHFIKLLGGCRPFTEPTICLAHVSSVHIFLLRHQGLFSVLIPCTCTHAYILTDTDTYIRNNVYYVTVPDPWTYLDADIQATHTTPHKTQHNTHITTDTHANKHMTHINKNTHRSSSIAYNANFKPKRFGEFAGRDRISRKLTRFGGWS